MMKGPIETVKPGQANNNANQPVDFSEYVWMAEENTEDFDKKVVDEMWEEDFIEKCFEDLLRDEEEETWYPADQENEAQHIEEVLSQLQLAHAQNIPASRLNPEAPEFVPRSYGSDDS